MGGEVVHFEIPSDNVERARRFYHRTFGWRLAAMPGIDYTVVTTTRPGKGGRAQEPGAINGGLLLRQVPVRSPTVTIRVGSIARSARTIEKNGGKVLEPRAPIGDGTLGFAAYFRDTEGNVLGLFEQPRAASARVRPPTRADGNAYSALGAGRARRPTARRSTRSSARS
jgi:uncharacterized protein